MACVYFMMTIMSIPAMVFYFSGNPATDLSPAAIIPSLTLGNIGQSQTVCTSGIYDPETESVEMSLKCPFGQLAYITQFG